MTNTASASALFILLALPAQAQNLNLRLNCQGATSFDYKTGQWNQVVESFFAKVHIRVPRDDVSEATIAATTLYCQRFVGRSTDWEVGGECEGVMKSGEKVLATLKVNNGSGIFTHTIIQAGHPVMSYSGYCTPAKKMF